MDPLPRDRRVVIVIGKTGYGKSVLTRRLTRQVPRLLVFDPLYDADVNYEDTDAVTDDIMRDVYADPRTSFRVGSGDVDDVPRLGHAAFVAGHCVLLLDEVSLLFEKGTRKLPSWAHRIVFLGRHRRVSLVVVAQRASSIPIDIRSQATHIYAFAQHEADDLAWLRECFSRQDCARLPHLTVGTYLTYPKSSPTSPIGLTSSSTREITA